MKKIRNFESGGIKAEKTGYIRSKGEKTGLRLREEEAVSVFLLVILTKSIL